LILGPSNNGPQSKRKAAAQEKSSSEDDGDDVTMAQKKARLEERLAQMYPDSGEYLTMVIFRVY